MKGLSWTIAVAVSGVFVATVPNTWARFGKGTTGKSTNRLRQEADHYFHSKDADGNGVLAHPEQSGVLQREINKWDENKNGVIEFGEYVRYYLVVNSSLYSRVSPGKRKVPDKPKRSVKNEKESPSVHASKGTVYDTDHLPKGLPKWWTTFDRDCDGQVALYEWKQSASSSSNVLQDFRKRDANADGFITVEEMLRYQQVERARNNANSGKSRTKVISPSFSTSGSVGRSDFRYTHRR